MMNKTLFVIVLLLLLAGLSPSVCLANSAQPPSIAIIVQNPPDDMEITLESNEDLRFSEFGRNDLLFGSVFTLYSPALKTGTYSIKVTTGGTTTSISLPAPVQAYNNLYTLSLGDMTVSTGKSVIRTITIVTLRVLSTLLIEGLIFFGFGFRQKRSWLIFLTVNLLTQGVLFGLMSTTEYPMNSYLILSLIFWEIIITVIELTLFMIFINEKRRWLTGIYVFIANLLSLYAGGWLLMLLPI